MYLSLAGIGVFLFLLFAYEVVKGVMENKKK